MGVTIEICEGLRGQMPSRVDNKCNTTAWTWAGVVTQEKMYFVSSNFLFSFNMESNKGKANMSIPSNISPPQLKIKKSNHICGCQMILIDLHLHQRL